MSFFENTRKPEGFGGKIMVAMMNVGHSAVARLGLRFLELTLDAKVLDCGCGGGANMKRLLKNARRGSSRALTIPPSAWRNPKRSMRLPSGRDAALFCKAAWRI